MANHAASFELNMKNRQALSAITELKRSVHHLAADINSELAKTAGAFISFEAIKSLIESTVEFGVSISKAADNIKIAGEEMQALKLIMRDAHKDAGFIEKIFVNLAKSRGMALGKPGGAQGKGFANLGIGADEIQHGRKADLLSHMLQGAANQPDKGFANLSAVFGAKVAEVLTNPKVAAKLGRFQEFKNEKLGEGAIASDKHIDAVTEAKEAFEDLTDIVRIGLMPALASLIEWATNLVGGYMKSNRTMDEMDREAESIYASKHGGQSVNAAKHLFYQSSYSTGAALVAANPFQSQAEKDAMMKEKQYGFIKAIYGADVADELNKSFKPSAGATVLDKLKERQEERRKEREAGRNAPENVQPTVKGDRAPASHKLEELKADQFIKIGGLMTADTHYRVDRLQYEMADAAKRTADNSDVMVNQLDDVIGLLAEGGFEAGA